MKFSPALITNIEPLEVHEEIPAAAIELNDVHSIADKPVKVEVTIYRSETEDGESTNLIATGWATTTLSLLCARDGAMFPQLVRAKVEHVFEAPHPATIDLTDFIREDILLEIPLNPVCKLKTGNHCPVTNEVIKPRKESVEPLDSTDVWAELSKLEPKPKAKPKSKAKPKK